MATISVQHQHSLGQEEAVRRAQTLLADLGERLKATIAWDGPHATVKGTGFNGTADVQADKISLNLDLGFLLRPMKGKIEERITKSLQERFT